MLGFFLLLSNLNIITYDIRHWVLSWQALLITIGAILLVDKRNDNKNAGLILIAIGGIFLLPKICHIDISRVLFPLLIICVGIFFIIAAVRRKNRPKHHRARRNYKNGENFEGMPYTETPLDDSEKIKREYVFMASKERWTYGNIKSIEIEAVFSGVELDLTQTELANEAQQINIKITSVFSGVTLFVPLEWNILIQKTGVFGGFVDKRPGNLHPEEGKTVILELEAVFGGGEIKCYE
jgi:predicted membrane protein